MHGGLVPGVSSADGRTVEIMRVTEATLAQAWPTAYGLLESLDEQVPALLLRQDVPELVLGEQVQLWLINDVQEFFFAVLSELRQYPRGRMLNIFWASGSRMRQALPLLSYIEAWAEMQGATFMQVQGRPGWSRMLAVEGYKSRLLVLQKPIEKKRMN